MRYYILLIGVAFSCTVFAFNIGILNPNNAPKISVEAGYTPYATVSGGSATSSVAEAGVIAAAASWASQPVRGTEYYYCDCGVGAEAGCVAGNDANGGTSKDAPRMTIAHASDFSRFTLGTTLSTISLCKGGSFEVLSPLYLMGSVACPAGTTCRDFREYSPTTFVGTNAPLLFKQGTSTAGPVINLTSGGGIRIFNLHLVGNSRDNGIFLYSGSHDVEVGNTTIDGFSRGLYSETSSGGQVLNVTMTGNTILNSTGMGFLGGGSNFILDNNSFVSNGGSSAGDHSIYLSSSTHTATNISVSGNYVYGQYGPLCRGTVIVAHGSFDTIHIDRNYVETAPLETEDTCWGISISGAAYPNPQQFLNATIRGNIVINGGNNGISTAFSPYAIIEDNIVVMNWAYGPSPGVASWAVTGMSIPASIANPAKPDTQNTANRIRNNTIWFGPLSAGGTGIKLSDEGTDHIISNNTVSMASTGAGISFNVLDLPLPLAAYKVVDNNHGYSPIVNQKWEVTHGATLSAWRSYSGFDTVSIEGYPLFTDSAAHDFSLQTNSPLHHSGTGDSVGGVDLFSPNVFNGVSSDRLKSVGAYK